MNNISLDSFMQSTTGTWRLTERETGPFGKKYWIDAQGTVKDNRILRADGYILDSDSLVVCCMPTSLLINKKTWDLVPNPSLVANPLCSLNGCVSCSAWELEWLGSQLIITYCDGTRLKYTRI